MGYFLYFHLKSQDPYLEFRYCHPLAQMLCEAYNPSIFDDPEGFEECLRLEMDCEFSSWAFRP